MKDKELLERAKSTPYKHSKWFMDGNKTVYEAIDYYVKSNDFYLDFSNRIQHVSQIKGYQGKTNRKDITDWLIEKKDYDSLIIRYSGREKGTDRGVLKVQTFLILKGYKDVA